MLEIQHVAAERGRNQQERRESNDGSERPRSWPQQQHEGWDEGKTHHARIEGEGAENAGAERSSPQRGEEGPCGEREKESVRVGGREHEREGIERDVESGVRRSSSVEDDSRDADDR